MKRTLVALLAIAATVVIVASVVGAGTSHTSGDIEATTFIGAFTGALTGAVTGAVTGNVTGNLTGNAAGALGNFTVVESDTLKPGSGTAFYLRAKDGQNDADLNCADFSGNLTGNVSGNTSTLFQAVAYKGNLPTAGDNTGEFFKNTVGDSGWVADNDSWVQLWP